MDQMTSGLKECGILQILQAFPSLYIHVYAYWIFKEFRGSEGYNIYWR